MSRRATAAVLCLVLVGGGCGWLGGEDGTASSPADWPAALASDGERVLYGERLTGSVRSAVLGQDGLGPPETVAQVEVRGAADDQRGLLGLAVIDAAVVAAWTRARDGRLVVGEVAPRARIVWEGPESSDRANGGHLVVAPDGRLVIGVGDLLQPGRVADPAAPNGKILALDPDGAADQTPEIVSTGWNNPFAFTYDTEGNLWVADNGGPSTAERIGRGDDEGALAELAPADAQVAPAALIALADGSLGLCGFLTRSMERIDLTGDRAAPTGTPVSDIPCAIGALALPDDRAVFATETELTVVTLPR